MPLVLRPDLKTSAQSLKVLCSSLGTAAELLAVFKKQRGISVAFVNGEKPVIQYLVICSRVSGTDCTCLRVTLEACFPVTLEN